MEKITSRKNPFIRRLRALAGEPETRVEQGEYLCDGMKLLQEALAAGAEVRALLWKERPREAEGLKVLEQYTAPEELFDYASPLKNSPGPLFTVAIPAEDRLSGVRNAIVLEGVQDPGNVGTVIRTANAFGIGAVILTGGCADRFHPRTVRATMGAVFRQRVLSLETAELPAFLGKNSLPLYGAALSGDAADVREVPLGAAAVAVGSEGRGLSRELLDLCRKRIVIPMEPGSESLNAAMAGAVLMWEMARETEGRYHRGM